MVAMHDTQSSLLLHSAVKDEEYIKLDNNLCDKICLYLFPFYKSDEANVFLQSIQNISIKNSTLFVVIEKRTFDDQHFIANKPHVAYAFINALGVSADVTFIEGLLAKSQSTQQSLEGNFCEADENIAAPALLFSALNSYNTEKHNPAEGYQLDDRYTFENFVPDIGNHMGYVASNDVVKSPGTTYSPLFLFGGAGIGKTHLLQAIGLELRKKNPNCKVVYLSGEQWVNAFVAAVRDKTFDNFRRRFRTNCDILLVDDIQFLAGKTGSQDEFFHTFNALHQERKQIVVTSDQYPHQINGFEERLQTRLAWGLIADMRPPGYSGRVEILRRKAKLMNLSLSNEAAELIAGQISRSVRELEGALVRLTAYAAISKSKIDAAFVKQHLQPFFKNDVEGITADKVIASVCGYYNIRAEDIKGDSRQKQVVIARQMAMMMCRRHLAMSLPQIGQLFSSRSHSTVLSAIQRMQKLIENEISMGTVLTKIEKDLFS